MVWIQSRAKAKYGDGHAEKEAGLAAADAARRRVEEEHQQQHHRHDQPEHIQQRNDTPGLVDGGSERW